MTDPSFQIKEIIRLALAEDIGPGDLTTSLTVAPDAEARAEISAKQDLVVAGLEAARFTFEMVDPLVAWTAKCRDGEFLRPGDVLVEIAGPAGSILTAERTALNFLMRLSGVATVTARFVEAVQGTRARVVDTRKTTPGQRALEKAAVRAGGGFNHRFGLFDGVLIKDNHIAAAGSVAAAVTLAKKGAPHTAKIEVEVEDLDQLEEALQAGADVILLDNMDLARMRRAVEITAGRALLEASGGVNLTTVAEIAATGVDIISAGALTHSAPAVDLSLNFK